MVYFNDISSRMNKKLLMIIVAGIFLVSTLLTVSATIYRNGADIDLKVPCFNSSAAYCSSSATCNLTIYDQDQQLVVDKGVMTNSESYFNYSLTGSNLTKNGEYSAITTCVDSGDYGYDTFTFNVTQNGETPSIYGAIFYIGIAILLLVFIVLSVIGMKRTQKPYLVVLYFGIFWLSLIALSYTTWVATENFFIGNAFIGKFFYWIFFITMVATLPLFFGSIIWYFYLIFKMKQIQDMLKHGVPYDRALARSIRNDQSRIGREGGIR